jgi:hypothetical protein
MRLCKCLGENFVTYITDLMPIFLRSADLSIDINTDEQDCQRLCLDCYRYVYILFCFDFFFFLF